MLPRDFLFMTGTLWLTGSGELRGARGLQNGRSIASEQLHVALEMGHGSCERAWVWQVSSFRHRALDRDLRNRAVARVPKLFHDVEH